MDERSSDFMGKLSCFSFWALFLANLVVRFVVVDNAQ
jgi:hypothetical protein